MSSVVTSASTATVLLRAERLAFAHAQRPVLVDVNLELYAGEFCALVGPNGSGKSTLVRLLLGLLRAQHGRVTAPSGNVVVGYVPQRHAIAPDVPATVAEIVETGLLRGRLGMSGRLRRGRSAPVADALAAVGLADRSHSRWGELSGGQQQRVLIARALVRRPQLLVLDEPVAGVDAPSQQAFRRILDAAVNDGTCVLLVSHELSAVADALQRIVVLRHGGIDFDGSPNDLRAAGIHLGYHPHDLPAWLER